MVLIIIIQNQFNKSLYSSKYKYLINVFLINFKPYKLYINTEHCIRLPSIIQRQRPRHNYCFIQFDNKIAQ